MAEQVLCSWSGGKDSLWALLEWERSTGGRVDGLLTTVNEDHRRISMHGVREDLLERQSRSLGRTLHRVWLPSNCSNKVYKRRMERALRPLIEDGLKTVIFGDLFLGDVRAYREEQMRSLAVEPCFPIWNWDTHKLYDRFVNRGYRAVVSCVDPVRLDPSFAGRELDRGFVHDLPPGVDPCGENGEFHTFVWDGPAFGDPVSIRTGKVVRRDGFVYCDLIPQNHPESNVIPDRET